MSALLCTIEIIVKRRMENKKNLHSLIMSKTSLKTYERTF